MPFNQDIQDRAEDAERRISNSFTLGFATVTIVITAVAIAASCGHVLGWW